MYRILESYQLIGHVSQCLIFKGPALLCLKKNHGIDLNFWFSSLGYSKIHKNLLVGDLLSEICMRIGCSRLSHFTLRHECLVIVPSVGKQYSSQGRRECIISGLSAPTQCLQKYRSFVARYRWVTLDTPPARASTTPPMPHHSSSPSISYCPLTYAVFQYVLYSSISVV